MVILGTKESVSLDKYLHVDELEKRLGGKLNNLTEYWPIKSTNKIYDDVSERFNSEVVEDFSEYFSVLNDSTYFNERLEEERRVESSRCCCSQDSCSLF
jgi:hypothetical protein